MTSVPPQLDHIILAGPDLSNATAYVETRLGVRLTEGGQHPAWGTRNAILPLSPSTYLEVIGPQEGAALPLVFGIDRLTMPRLVTWAAKAVNLSDLVADARAQGIDLGKPRSGQRLQPDGSTISWQSTDPFAPRASGVIPFFIEWMGDAHPAKAAPHVVRLVRLYAEHPDARTVADQVQSLGIQLEVVTGKAPRLIAELISPDGTTQLA
jgi:hypothetical protein